MKAVTSSAQKTRTLSIKTIFGLNIASVDLSVMIGN